MPLPLPLPVTQQQQQQQQHRSEGGKGNTAGLAMEPLLLLEGKPFHFELDGDDTDDDFDEAGRRCGEEEGLSSSTLDILIEHFSRDGELGGVDGVDGGGSAAFEEHAPPAFSFDVCVEENARDAF
jgi:hypothetical protein